MPVSFLNDYVKSFQELFLETFDQQEFRELLLYNLEFDVSKEIPVTESQRGVVLNVLLKAVTGGWLLKLAQEAARKKPGQPAWDKLVKDLEVDPIRLLAPLPPGVMVVARSSPLPKNLTKLLVGYDELGPEHWAQPQAAQELENLVMRMTGLLPEDHHLADEYHTSPREGERLVAILALRERPDARYLRWLSERFAVEPPFLAYQASLAIRAAADVLAETDLNRVSEATRKALNCIALGLPRTDRPEALAQAVTLVNLVVGKLAETLKEIKKRTTGLC